MKLFVGIFVLGFLGLFFQGMFAYMGVPPALQPQLLALLMLFLSFFEVSVLGAWLAFFLGLMMDFSSALLIGPWAGAYIATYGGIAALSQRLFVDSWSVATVTAFLGTVGVDLIYAVLTTERQPISWGTLGVALGQGFVTAAIAPICFPFMRRFVKSGGSNPLGSRGAVPG